MMLVIDVGQRSNIHSLMFFSPTGGLLQGWRLGNNQNRNAPTYHRTTVPYHRTTVPYPVSLVHTCRMLTVPILKMNWYSQHPTRAYKWNWVRYKGTVRWYVRQYNGTMAQYDMYGYVGKVSRRDVVLWVICEWLCRTFCLPAGAQPRARAGVIKKPSRKQTKKKKHDYKVTTEKCKPSPLQWHSSACFTLVWRSDLRADIMKSMSYCVINFFDVKVGCSSHKMSTIILIDPCAKLFHCWFNIKIRSHSHPSALDRFSLVVPVAFHCMVLCKSMFFLHDLVLLGAVGQSFLLRFKTGQ